MSPEELGDMFENQVVDKNTLISRLGIIPTIIVLTIIQMKKHDLLEINITSHY